MLCVHQRRLIIKHLLVLHGRATGALAPDVLRRERNESHEKNTKKNKTHLPLMDVLVVSLTPGSRHKTLHNLGIAGEIHMGLNDARSGRIRKAFCGAVPAGTGDALIDGHLLSRSCGSSRLRANASSSRSDNCSETHVFRLRREFFFNER